MDASSICGRRATRASDLMRVITAIITAIITAALQNTVGATHTPRRHHLHMHTKRQAQAGVCPSLVQKRRQTLKTLICLFQLSTLCRCSQV